MILREPVEPPSGRSAHDLNSRTSWLTFNFKFGLSILLLALMSGARTASSQTAPPTVRVDVKVVNVLATVHNKHGEIISNLTKDDFDLKEDGRPQTIRYFSREADLPLKLGLLVDTSLSERRMLDQEKSASYAFFDQVLQVDRDLAFVIHFDREVELLQDFTSSRQKLDAALADLQIQQPRRDQNQGRGGDSPGSYPGSQGGRAGFHPAGTLLYDSIYLAANELMKKQSGRKVLIVLSDGRDRGSKESLANAVMAAQRADTLIYSILFADQQGYGGRGGFYGPGMGGMGRRGGRGRYPEETGPDGKKVLDQISTETGGRLFEVSKKQPIEKIYDSIEEDLRNQYSLGYTPEPQNSPPGYHKIALTAKDRYLVVHAREGYYSEQ